MNRILQFIGCIVSASSLFANMPTAPAGAQEPPHSITPDAGPRVLGGWDMFMTADFIYWTTRVDGLSSVMSGYPPTGTSSGKVFHPNWQWNSGFKVGLGSNLARDGWDTSLDFTWIESEASKSAKGASLFPMWNIAHQYDSFTPGDLFASDSTWSFWMNWFDLELGRNYFVSPRCKLRPFTGLKAAFGMQHFEVQYTRQIDFNNQAHDTMTNNFHYFGIGPRAGINTTWQFSEEWSLYADAATSLLWSQFRGKRRDEAQTLPESLNKGVITQRTKNHLNTCRAVFEFGLGLRWEIWFSDDDYHFLIQAGWEEQVWLNYNQVIQLTEQGINGDLSTEGLTVHFRFDF